MNLNNSPLVVNTFPIQNYANFNEIKLILEDCAKKGQPNHERLAIIEDNNHLFKLGTQAAPASIWGRFWEWLFGVNKNVKAQQVAQFAANFFKKHESLITSSPHDQQKMRDHILILKSHLCQNAEALAVIDRIIKKIDEVNAVILSNAKKINEEADKIVEESRKTSQQILQETDQKVKSKLQNVEIEKDKLELAILQLQRKKSEIEEQAHHQAEKIVKEGHQEYRQILEKATQEREAKLQNLEKEEADLKLVIEKLQKEQLKIEEENSNLKLVSIANVNSKENHQLLLNLTTDTVFKSKEGNEIYVHAPLLSKITHFANETRSQMKPSEPVKCLDAKERKLLELSKPYSVEVIQAFVDFLYSHQTLVLVPEIKITELLDLADEIGYCDLKEACEREIIKNIDLENSFEWENELQYSLIHQHIVELFSKNFLAVTKDERFLKFSPQTIRDLLKRDDLIVEKEAQVLVSLTRWAIEQFQGDNEKTYRLINGLDCMNEAKEEGVPVPSQPYPYIRDIRFEYIDKQFFADEKVNGAISKLIEPAFFLEWMKFYLYKKNISDQDLDMLNKNIIGIEKLRACRSNFSHAWNVEESNQIIFTINSDNLIEHCLKAERNIPSPHFLIDGVRFCIIAGKNGDKLIINLMCVEPEKNFQFRKKVAFRFNSSLNQEIKQLPYEADLAETSCYNFSFIMNASSQHGTLSLKSGWSATQIQRRSSSDKTFMFILSIT